MQMAHHTSWQSFKPCQRSGFDRSTLAYLLFFVFNMLNAILKPLYGGECISFWYFGFKAC